MEASDIIIENDFSVFLQKLGVNTYNQSFEWLVNDTQFSPVLHWLYKHLDHSNVLTDREESRYAEIENAGQLLSPEQLETCIQTIKTEYEGIHLSGESEDLEDINIHMQEEKLKMLERHEKILTNYIEENKHSEEELENEINFLNLDLQMGEEKKAAEKCFLLAQEVEGLTEECEDIASSWLNFYANANIDEELGKRLVSHAPLDSYKQLQLQFLSDYNFFVAKSFIKANNEQGNYKKWKRDINEAILMEERLSHVMHKYISSQVQVREEQAVLQVTTTFAAVDPEDILSFRGEINNMLDIYEDQRSSLCQQITQSVKKACKRRSERVERAVADNILEFRQRTDSDLTFLLDITQRALGLDRILYYSLRQELETQQGVLEFSSYLLEFVNDEELSVHTRMKCMKDVCADYEQSEIKIENEDSLVSCLSTLFETTCNDASLFVNHYKMLQTDINRCMEHIEHCFKQKEEALIARSNSTKTKMLHEYVFDGSTNQPNCWNSSTARLLRTLNCKLNAVEKSVRGVSEKYIEVKNGDKEFLRKLWQWFLTDARKLASITNGAIPSHVKNNSSHKLFKDC